MRKIVVAAALVIGLAALGACHRGGDSNELTAEENAQLNDATNMLDASPDGLAVTNAPIGNGENATDADDDGDEDAVDNAAEANQG
jgi:hypothetical protein